MKNKHNKSNINTDGYAAMIFFVIMIVIALIFGGYWIRNNFNCEGDMFSYSGAVIGGGLTLIGVIITILYQEIKREEDRIQRENERKEELTIQYKPIVYISNQINVAEVYDEAIIFNLKLINSGRGEANNISILPSMEKAFDFKLEQHTYSLASQESTNIKLILKKNIDEISKDPTLEEFFSYRWTKEDTDDEGYAFLLNFPLDKCTVHFKISYNDLLENKYTKLITSTFTRNVRELRRFYRDKDYFGIWQLEQSQEEY